MLHVLIRFHVFYIIWFLFIYFFPQFLLSFHLLLEHFVELAFVESTGHLSVDGFKRFVEAVEAVANEYTHQVV